MSWVVSRHLYKSGGNDIQYRIGNYNKFSSSKMVRCKRLSNALMASPYCVELQRKLSVSRRENILYNNYASIDHYISSKMLYPSNPKINHNHQDLWIKTYAREIIDKFSLCTSTIRLLGYSSLCEYICYEYNADRDDFLGRVIKIIKKNKKYNSVTNNARLPPNWVEYMDEEGYMGYYNLNTKKITYSTDFILVEEIKNLIGW
jgi:hypothetical protein